MEQLEIERVLGTCEFFKGLGKDDIQKVVGLCHIEDYDVGESVFVQGDFGENLYIVAEGHVFLERSVNLGGRKGSVVIETLGKGRVLGCWSTLLGESHNLMSSAICQKPTKVVMMKGADLRNMMLENAEFGFKILERFCFLLKTRIQAAYGALEKI